MRRPPSFSVPPNPGSFQRGDTVVERGASLVLRLFLEGRVVCPFAEIADQIAAAGDARGTEEGGSRHAWRVGDDTVTEIEVGFQGLPANTWCFLARERIASERERERSSERKRGRERQRENERVREREREKRAPL